MIGFPSQCKIEGAYAFIGLRIIGGNRINYQYSLAKKLIGKRLSRLM